VGALAQRSVCRTRGEGCCESLEPPHWLRAQPLAAARAASGHNLAATFGRHAGAKTMSALAHQLAGLIGPLHGWVSADIPSLGGKGRAQVLTIEVSMGRRARKSRGL